MSRMNFRKMTTDALLAEAAQASADDDFDRLYEIDSELIRREAAGEIPEADR